MITDEVYVEIQVLRRQGLSLRRIVSEVGCAGEHSVIALPLGSATKSAEIVAELRAIGKAKKA